jgi:putative DNA-invertase from lambdoid prophage Rac
MAAYGYVRTGVDGAGLTVAEQKTAIKGCAMAYGTEIAEWYVDERVPGWTPAEARKAAGAMCDKVAPGDLVFVCKLEKLFRSAADALSVLTRQAEQNIGLIVVDFGVMPVNLHGAGQIFFRLLRLTAEFERERLIEQPVSARRVKSLTGGAISGSAPFGFRVKGTPPNAKLVEDPDEQEAIRTMMRLRSEMSLRKIADEVFHRHAIRISHEGVRQVLADTESRLSLTGEGNA